MKTVFLVTSFSFFIFSCKEPAKKNPVNPIGIWESEVPWDNNDITVTVRPDSMILFKAKKIFCPGTKFFVSVGKWSVENDSFLVMKQHNFGKKFMVKELFPELEKTEEDSANVIGVDIEARFILTKDHLYDIETNGKRSKNKIYIRK
ncbi:MAG TPA: hypothetical protein VFJ43_18345 [Bacteroidia bacterium]|nr:hypothetical protein [Bacteroidia bacterium]